MPACASYAAATGRLRLPGGLVSVPNRPWREVSTVSSAMGHQVRLWSSDVAGRLSRAIGVRTANVVGRLGSMDIPPAAARPLQFALPNAEGRRRDASELNAITN